MHRHADLTVTDLSQRPRVLALDPRRVLTVLRKPGVIQHPRLDIDLRCHPLRDRLDHQRRIPWAIRQELLHALIVSVPQPIDQRLKRLASPLLDQPPQVQAAIANLRRTVHRLPQHLHPERLQPLAHHRRRLHPLILRTRNTHNRHHDLLAFDDNREKSSPQIARIPTRKLTKYY